MNQAIQGDTLTDRQRRWISTMRGYIADGLGFAHAPRSARVGSFAVCRREEREELEYDGLAPNATRSGGPGARARFEHADPLRTAFEQDRDRIIHSSEFRRLAGKAQVFVFPDDHQRTRLTHALEVARVAVTIARGCRLNVPLAEAIALGHDCGHGPFGHLSEDVFDTLMPGGFDHAPWGADVTLRHLNLRPEVADGIRNHSWSRPAPMTPEGEVVALADRIAYTCHDAEDAAAVGLVRPEELPRDVRERLGSTQSAQLDAFVADVVGTTQSTGLVAMSADAAEALATFRAWNQERIYRSDGCLVQARRVNRLLLALLEWHLEHPGAIGRHVADLEGEDRDLAVMTHVVGMTDRAACRQAREVLGWPDAAMPDRWGDV